MARVMSCVQNIIMGLETRCAVTVTDPTGVRTDADAKVLLEGTALVVRGPARITLPREHIGGVEVHGSTLLVTHIAGTVALELGDLAEKWRSRLAEGPKSRAHKLGVQAGTRVTLVEVNDPTIGREIAEAGGVVLDEHLPGAPVDLVITELRSPDDLARVRALADGLTGGALWVVHPNGDATVGDEAIFAVADELGLVYTKVMSFSAGMSAERLSRPKPRR